MDQGRAWELVKPHVKLLLADVLDVVLKPALEDAIAKSETKVDDALLAVLEGPLLAALKEQISHL